MKFTATQWNTAEDKAKWFEKFKRFVAAGMPAGQWNQPLYRQLSNMFGHIAHYDAGGFYGTWFETPRQRYEFIRNALERPCYGDPAWVWSDVEQAIQEWLKETQQLRRFHLQAEAEQETREIAVLRELAAKYPQAVAAPA